MNKYIISDIAPWFVTAAGAVVSTYITITAITQLRKWMKPGRRTILLWLLIITGVAALIRFNWVPNTRRIYFDEDRYLMYAVSFARTGHELGVRLATPTNVILGDPDPGARVTVPTIHAWLMRTFGYNDAPLFIAAKTASTLQVVLLFALTYLLFHSALTALIASGIYAILPITVYWSVTTNLDSYFAFFGILTALMTLWYIRHPNISRGMYMFAALSLLLFVRIEGLLFVPIMIATIVLKRKELGKAILHPSDIFPALFVILLLGVRVYIALPLFSQTWCCAEATPLEIFQVSYIARNIIPNILTFVVQPEFPAIISILAFFALFAPHRLSKKNIPIHAVSTRMMLAAWILFYFLIYCCYYAGQFYSFTFSGSYGRFFLMIVPPAVILCAVTVTEIWRIFIRATNKTKMRMLALSVVTLLTLYPTIASYMAMIQTSPWDAMVDAGPRMSRSQLVQNILPNIPTSAILIHPLTAVPLMEGRTIVAYEAFLSSPVAQEFVKHKLKEGVQVYILHTDTCTLTPYKCSTLLPDFRFIPTPLGHDEASTIIGIDEVRLIH